MCINPDMLWSLVLKERVDSIIVYIVCEIRYCSELVNKGSLLHLKWYSYCPIHK